MKTLGVTMGAVLVLLLAACGNGDKGLRPERPSKRSDVTGVAGANGNIAVFGGDDGPIVDQQPMAAFRADTWVFEPGLGWFEAASAQNPSARGRYAATYDSDRDAMLIFGGRFRTTGTTGAYTLLNDLWAFSFATNEWSLIDDGSNGAPSGRFFPALAYSSQNSTVYMFGGGTNASAFPLAPNLEVWAHDGTSWSQVIATGTPPTIRMFTGYMLDPSRNRLVIYAGQIGDFLSPGLLDLYALDMNTHVWSRIHDGTGIVGTDVPPGRFSGMLVYDEPRDRYLMTGGHQDFLLGNDVWAFDPNGNTWSPLNQGDTLTGSPLGCLGNPQEIPADYVSQDVSAPQPRTGGAFARVGDQAYWFGGESDCSDHLDDIWSFDLASNTWSELISARSGESCLRRDVACSCLCL